MRKRLLLAFFPVLATAQTQIGTDLNGLLAGDNAGFSVTVSANGNVVAVGNPMNDNNGTDSGCVRIYKNLSGTWALQATLNGEAAGNQSGYSVAFSADGTSLAIGAIHNNNHTGHVRVYKDVSGVWTQAGSDIDGQNYGDTSGWSVSLSTDGNTVAVGSPYNTNNGNDSGIVRLYRLVGSSWSQLGNDINGWFYDAFGRSVSLSADGNTVAIGSPYNSMNGAYTGRVRIYKLASGIWTQEGADIRGANANEISGYSVSLSADGSTVAIGSIGNGSTVNSGSVKVFRNVSGTWTQLGSAITGMATGDNSGRSVSLSGDGSVLAIGANMNATGGTGAGHVRIYKNVAGVWQQRGIAISGMAGDNCGMSVALSADGNTLIIGSPYNANNGTAAGQARVFDISQILASDDFVWNSFSLYPNPASDNFSIQLGAAMELQEVLIYNAIGQLIKKTKTLSVDVASLAKGTYFVEVFTDKGKAAKSIIVE